MKKEIKLYKKGLEKHSKTGIFLGNLAMILWIVFGTIACWFLHPLIAWVYLALALIMVFVVLRKLVCTNCYYYNKWCPIGWGKLCALFFKKGNIEKFGDCIGLKLAPLTYGLLSLVPIISVIISLIQNFLVYKIIVLLFLILISYYSGTIGRKKSCSNCKMKLICPGSAVK